MADDNTTDIISWINKLYDFFELWNILIPLEYHGEVSRVYRISTKPSSCWLGVDVTTTHNGQETSTHIGIKKNYRKLTLEGNTRDPQYRLELPRYPQEEDRVVRGMLFAIHNSAKLLLTSEVTSIELVDKFYHY